MSLQTGDGVQYISRFQPQCANLAFSDQSRYSILFQQVFHKEGDSAIKYIKIFQNTKDLAIIVGKIYSEYQFMHTFSDNLQQGVKLFAQIANHQAYLRREEKRTSLIKHHYIYLTYKLIILICTIQWEIMRENFSIK